MKSITGLVVVIILGTFSHSASAASFGFHRGMTKDEVVRLVGKSAVTKSTQDALGGYELVVNTAPKPYSLCTRYHLNFSPTEGLLAASCSSEPAPDNLGDWKELQTIFDSVKLQLTVAYDSPMNESDGPAPSKYGPESLMHTASWSDSSGGQVMLFGLASHDGTYRINISYLFKGWFSYIDRVQAKDAPL
jgi:hypothetical protein